ncbi:MAG: DUF542 domain-containing protein [Prolixibacteraceae bacterium]|nr:DUF542 domain-containing protein [Prolixibacteraceae bacterium]
MSIQLNTPVGELVRANFQTAKIFEKYRIDFCCGGKQSIAQASERINVNAQQVLSEVEQSLTRNDPDAAWFEKMTLDRLCDISNLVAKEIALGSPFLHWYQHVCPPIFTDLHRGNKH